MWSVWQVVLVGLGGGLIALILRMLWVALFRTDDVSNLPSLHPYELTLEAGSGSTETPAGDLDTSEWVQIDVEPLIELSETPPGARWIDLPESQENSSGKT